MGCGGSKSEELQHLSDQQLQAMKKQEQMASQQQQQIRLQAEALENARSQQAITNQQFEEQKAMLLQQQSQLVQQQQEALQMALMAKQQAELAANTAAEQALKKAEEMRRRITPPAKPGKINILVQTDRTIPPHAIMKRRKKKDSRGFVIDTGGQDHREECGGVGSDAVKSPHMAQVPILVAKEKEGEAEEEPEYEYQYEYQYQYQYNADQTAAGAVSGPTAVVQPAGVAPVIMSSSAPVAAEVRKESAGYLPSVAPAPGTPVARLSAPYEPPAPTPAPTPAPPAAAPKPAGPVPDDDDYEYEYEDD